MISGWLQGEGKRLVQKPTYLEVGRNLFLTSSTRCCTSVRKVRGGLGGGEARPPRLRDPEALRPPAPYAMGGFPPTIAK